MLTIYHYLLLRRFLFWRCSFNSYGIYLSI